MQFLQETTQTYNLLHKANQQMTDIWLQSVLFTWRWWLGIFFALAPWLFWWAVRPKESASRLRYVMFLTIVIVSWLDFLGSVAFGLWHYYYEVLPFVPAFIPWDFSMIPVLVALFIQYKPRINLFVKALVFSGLFAFVGEPLFQWLKMYQPEQWKHYYSFVIMFAIYLVAHYASKADKFDPIK